MLEFKRKYMATTPGSLQGKLLIASPWLRGGVFEKTVIYVCDHSLKGAMGISINHVIAKVNFADILEQLKLEANPGSNFTPIYIGGPIQPERGFIIHSPDYEDKETFKFENNIALTSNKNIIENMISGKGPEKSIIALGYAGWVGGQLEKEVAGSNWLVAPATEDIVFNIENKSKWEAAIRSIGIEPYQFTDQIGNA